MTSRRMQSRVLAAFKMSFRGRRRAPAPFNPSANFAPRRELTRDIIETCGTQPLLRSFSRSSPFRIPAQAQATRPAEARIVILPFTALNPTQNQGWLGRSIQQSILADLTVVAPGRLLSADCRSSGYGGGGGSWPEGGGGFCDSGELHHPFDIGRGGVAHHGGSDSERVTGIRSRRSRQRGCIRRFSGWKIRLHRRFGRGCRACFLRRLHR